MYNCLPDNVKNVDNCSFCGRNDENTTYIIQNFLWSTVWGGGGKWWGARTYDLIYSIKRSPNLFVKFNQKASTVQSTLNPPQERRVGKK